MSRVIRISESIFQRLQKLATPLVDTSASVITKLLDFYDEQGQPEITVRNAAEPQLEESLSGRYPRQRGVTIKINGETFKADALTDLYKQVLQFICHGGYIENLKQHIPISTSSKRYLIATTPIHPKGNDFFAPVEYGGYYMEAHKSYKCGLDHLQKMLRLCGLSLTYID